MKLELVFVADSVLFSESSSRNGFLFRPQPSSARRIGREGTPERSGTRFQDPYVKTQKGTRVQGLHNDTKPKFKVEIGIEIHVVFGAVFW